MKNKMIKIFILAIFLQIIFGSGLALLMFFNFEKTTCMENIYNDKFGFSSTSKVTPTTGHVGRLAPDIGPSLLKQNENLQCKKVGL